MGSAGQTWFVVKGIVTTLQVSVQALIHRWAERDRSRTERIPEIESPHHERQQHRGDIYFVFPVIG